MNHLRPSENLELHKYFNILRLLTYVTPPLRYYIDSLTLISVAQLGAVVFVSAVVQGAAGFGFALLALPSVMLITGSADSIPLVIVLTLTICSGLAWRMRDRVIWPMVGQMLVGAVIGWPFGLLLFIRADETQLLIGVSVIVLGSAAYLIRRGYAGRATLDDIPGQGEPDVVWRGSAAAGIGGIAAAMTVALGMPGPPVVLYLAALCVRKDAMRATMMTFFVLVYVVSLGLQVGVVGVSGAVWRATAFLVPVGLVGGWVGDRLSGRLDEHTFWRCAVVLIALTGVAALGSVVLP